MNKDAIGILDMGVESFNILESLLRNFKHERFIYMNDLKHQPYWERTEQEVLDLIKANVERLMQENIKLLIVVSDVIIEYASEYFEKLTIPTINLVQSLIDYVNINYEQKNMILLAKSEIIDANLYQRNFKYNRLYNIASDDLENLIHQKMIKTSKSFSTVKETFKSISKKEFSIIITSSPFITNLKTEFTEYLKFGELTDVGEILSIKMKEDFSFFCEKGKKELIVLINTSKKIFKERTYWSDLKYKVEFYE